LAAVGDATGFDCGVATGGMGTGGDGGVAGVTGRGVWGMSAPVSFSSKRRSSSRSNPANLVFTTFGIALIFARELLLRRFGLFPAGSAPRREGKSRQTSNRGRGAARLAVVSPLDWLSTKQREIKKIICSRRSMRNDNCFLIRVYGVNVLPLEGKG